MASKFATFSTKALGAAFGAALTPLLAASPASAQLTVMISGGFSGSYEKLLPEFERTTGVKVVTKSGASQGNGP
jgi:molybdate transport system substrate-binding protein